MAKHSAPTIPAAGLLDQKALKALLDTEEQSTLLAQSLHDFLIQQGHESLARIAWVIYLNATKNGEVLEAALELAVGDGD
jgi:hypothetical protein